VDKVMLAALKSTTSNSDKSKAAKSAFFVALFDLSWRMLGAILGPLFIGLYIDSKRNNGQGFATAGFLIGMVLGVMAMRSIVRKLARNSR
jgi:F0F1-type ATP synthase assembly protein I